MAQVIIKNTKDLNHIMNKYIVRAMEITRDQIFATIASNIRDYYKEPVFGGDNPSKPIYYDRTKNLLHNFTFSTVKQNGDYFECSVGWDDDYLTFKYPSGFENSKYGSGYNGATGLQVLQWFDSESHGGTVTGSHRFFTEAIEELGGEAGILDLFKSNLKKAGIPVK